MNLLFLRKGICYFLILGTPVVRVVVRLPVSLNKGRVEGH
jgi:hypothetical protein